jgi:hypothetical protein
MPALLTMISSGPSCFLRRCRAVDVGRDAGVGAERGRASAGGRDHLRGLFGGAASRSTAATRAPRRQRTAIPGRGGSCAGDDCRTVGKIHWQAPCRWLMAILTADVLEDPAVLHDHHEVLPRILDQLQVRQRVAVHQEQVRQRAFGHDAQPARVGVARARQLE